MASISLCDPQPVVHEGLRAMLAAAEDLSLGESCRTIEQAHGLAARERPDVLIVDRAFGMHALLDLISRLRSRESSTRVVVWAASITDSECFRALQAGACGIVKKTVSAETLLECLRVVVRDEIWTETLSAGQEASNDRSRNRPLTPREREVADLVAKGMKNREIAEALGIATGTVKIHLMHIFEKTGIRDRFELALQGLRNATERERCAEEESSTDWAASPARERVE